MTAVMGLGLLSYVELTRLSREERESRKAAVAEAQAAIGGIEAEFAERVTANRSSRATPASLAPPRTLGSPAAARGSG